MSWSENGDFLIVTWYEVVVAFIFLFFLFSSSSLFFYKLRTRGRQAAVDSWVGSVIFSAAALVFLPVVSILVSTVRRGVPGLHASRVCDWR